MFPKRLICLLLCGCGQAPAPETAPPETTVPPTTQPLPTVDPTVSITAKNAFVYNCSRDHLAYIKDAGNTVMYPASITKLFTCYVALEYLSLEEEVLLGDEQSFVRWDASKAGFKVGETVTVEALLHGVLLPSGSDASYALAVAAGRKILNNPKADAASARDAFIGKMNDWAQRLGMGGEMQHAQPG